MNFLSATASFANNGGFKMFKKLVKMVSEIKTENDRDATFWQIDREFEQGKISAADHELLYKLAGMVEIEED